MAYQNSKIKKSIILIFDFLSDDNSGH
jgi:hypothetical protein